MVFVIFSEFVAWILEISKIIIEMIENYTCSYKISFIFLYILQSYKPCKFYLGV